MAVRVLIVDDHAPFRTAARLLLAADGFDVVGEVGDGVGAVAAAQALRPDVVLLDVQLPDTDGFGVAARLSGGRDAPAVVLVSSRALTDYGSLVDGSGARGFIAKAELDGAVLRDVLDRRRRAS